MTNPVQFEGFSSDYQPRSAPYFNPDAIIITKGSYQSLQQRNLVEAICSVYPKARIIEKLDQPHNRVQLDSTEPLRLHYQGKRTLVLGIHKSALRYSDEEDNTCPNYWHFSPYGFCPYDGRVRFPLKLRIDIYRYLIDTIKRLKPELHIGLCMEERQTFKALNLQSTIGCCNCVL